MAIMEDQQIGNQVVIFDDFQLVVTNIVFNRVRTEINPLGKFIEAFAFVLCRLDDSAEFMVTDIFQQGDSADDPPQLAEGVIQLVFPAGSPQLTQDGRWRNTTGSYIVVTTSKAKGKAFANAAFARYPNEDGYNPYKPFVKKKSKTFTYELYYIFTYVDVGTNYSIYSHLFMMNIMKNLFLLLALFLMSNFVFAASFICLNKANKQLVIRNSKCSGNFTKVTTTKLTGTPGTAGIMGLQGPAGPKGDKGDPGATGIPVPTKCVQSDIEGEWSFRKAHDVSGRFESSVIFDASGLYHNPTLRGGKPSSPQKRSGLGDFTSVPKAQSEIAKHYDIASSHLRSDVT